MEFRVVQVGKTKTLIFRVNMSKTMTYIKQWKDMNDIIVDLCYMQ